MLKDHLMEAIRLSRPLGGPPGPSLLFQHNYTMHPGSVNLVIQEGYGNKDCFLWEIITKC